MFERFSKPAREVVHTAVEEAWALGSPQVGTEHLLLALTQTGDEQLMRILAGLGVQEEAVRQGMQAHHSPRARFDDRDRRALAALGIDLDGVLDRLEQSPAGMADERRRRSRGRLSAHARKALQLGLREAIAQKSRTIGPRHLLLGILRAGDGLACTLLEEMGVEPGVIRRAVLETKDAA